ncbi:MAG: hypothetical protein EBS31_06565 [Burkholderiaceae bacterium]|nr:hypothetical protein [Burkholderiaceae bacterium]
MRKKIFATLCAAVLIGCAGTAVKTSELSLGMTKAEVLAKMGPPASSRATDGVEYLIYRLTPGMSDSKAAGCAALGLITFGISYSKDDCSGGKPEDYFAQFRDGKLISYGKVGDFNSTRDPTVNINQKIDINKK